MFAVIKAVTNATLLQFVCKNKTKWIVSNVEVIKIWTIRKFQEKINQQVYGRLIDGSKTLNIQSHTLVHTCNCNIFPYIRVIDEETRKKCLQKFNSIYKHKCSLSGLMKFKMLKKVGCRLYELRAMCLILQTKVFK